MLAVQHALRTGPHEDLSEPVFFHIDVKQSASEDPGPYGSIYQIYMVATGDFGEAWDFLEMPVYPEGTLTDDTIRLCPE